MSQFLFAVVIKGLLCVLAMRSGCAGERGHQYSLRVAQQRIVGPDDQAGYAADKLVACESKSRTMPSHQQCSSHDKKLI